MLVKYLEPHLSHIPVEAASFETQNGKKCLEMRKIKRENIGRQVTACLHHSRLHACLNKNGIV